MNTKEALSFLIETKTGCIFTGDKKLSKVCDIAIRAVNKQIARKYELFNGQCSCPNCKRLFGDYTQLKNLIHWEMSYCKHCGQALDWSDLE